MQYLVVGFLVMLGAIAAAASAPVIFTVAFVMAKLLLTLLVIGVIAGVEWFVRAPYVDAVNLHQELRSQEHRR